jgi:hypothetical protein
MSLFKSEMDAAKAVVIVLAVMFFGIVILGQILMALE